MASIGETSAAVVIHYAGTGEAVPKDVTKIVFDSTVTEIKEYACVGCMNLREVVFSMGGFERLGREHFGIVDH
ncbi:hypothetical protein ACHAXR_001526 [Thalassiosira sp. AJA248-18]